MESAAGSAAEDPAGAEGDSGEGCDRMDIDTGEGTLGAAVGTVDGTGSGVRDGEYKEGLKS